MFHDFAVIYVDENGNSETLNNVRSVTITRGRNTDSNNCDIILTSIGGVNLTYGEIRFNPGEEIQVWASRDEELDYTNTSHLIAKYLILDYVIGADDQTLKLKCRDRTFYMLNKIYVYRDDEERRANEIIENIVQVINSKGTGTTSIETDIQAVKSDSNAFKLISFISDTKTAYEAIQELSQPDLTGDDKTYQFWLDAEGTFHWQYPSSVPEDTVLRYCSYPVYEMTLDKPESNKAKMIIYNAGYDLEGEVIESFAYNKNASSISEAMIYQPMTEITRELRTIIALQHGLADTQDATILGVMTNSQFRDLVISLALAKCDRIFGNIGTGLWEAKVRVFGANYQVGGLYTIVCEETGFIPRDMRLERLTHYMDSNGWMTTLELAEEA